MDRCTLPFKDCFSLIYALKIFPRLNLNDACSLINCEQPHLEYIIELSNKAFLTDINTMDSEISLCCEGLINFQIIDSILKDKDPDIYNNILNRTSLEYKNKLSREQKKLVIFYTLHSLNSPNLKQLHDITRIPERTILDQIRNLEREGSVQIQREGGRKNGGYKIVHPGIYNLALLESEIIKICPHIYSRVRLYSEITKK